MLRYYDQYLPSLSVMLAAKSLNLEPKDIKVSLGQGISLGNLKIATDPALQMHTFFYKDTEGKPAFQVDSFYDVYSGKIPADKYRGKIVLIGATAAGIGASQVTPISPSMAPVLTLAHSVSSILKEDFYVSPGWSFWAEMGVFLFIALYLILLLPRLKAGMGAFVTALLLIALLATHFLLMVTQAMWLQLMAPAALLLTGHLLLTTKRYLLTEQGKTKSDAESAESNRMLGLAFQGQGQLDIAFEKFRKCPLDDSLMDVLYNLGLDFERKRQFNKAESVFRYMADFNPEFRDLKQRIERSKAMQDAIILGAGGGGTNATLILEGGAVEKPMLGRYQVEKELGKGAMGVVYLGKDPKIGRVVAIKTMALSQEFDGTNCRGQGALLPRSGNRRPAQPPEYRHHLRCRRGTRPRLHFDGIPERQGSRPYTKPGNLLPPQTVFAIIGRVADALDYAHASTSCTATSSRRTSCTSRKTTASR